MFFLRGTFLFLLLVLSSQSFATYSSHNSEIREEVASNDQDLGQQIIEALTEFRDSKDKVDPKYLEKVKTDKETLDLTEEQKEEIDKLIAELEGKKEESVVGKTPAELLNALSDSFNKKLSPWSAPTPQAESTQSNFFSTVADSTLKGFNSGLNTGTKFGAPLLGGTVGAAAGCINGLCTALSKPQPTHASSAPSQSQTQQPSSPDSSSQAETPSVPEATPDRAPASQSNQSTQSSDPTSKTSPNAEPSGVDTLTGKPVISKGAASSSANSDKKIPSSLPSANTPSLHGGEEKEKVFEGSGNSLAALNNRTSSQESQNEKIRPTDLSSNSNRIEKTPSDSQRNSSKPPNNPHPGAVGSPSVLGSKFGSTVASFRGTTEEPPAGQELPVPRETASVSSGTYSWRKGGEPNTVSSSGSDSISTTGSASSLDSGSGSASSSSSINSYDSNVSSSSSKKNRNKTGEKENASYLDLSPIAGNEDSLRENLNEIVEATGPTNFPERTPEEKARVAEKIQQVLDTTPPPISKELIIRGPASDLSNLLEATGTDEEIPSLPTSSPAIKAKAKIKVSPNKISTAGSGTPSKSFFDKILGLFQI